MPKTKQHAAYRPGKVIRHKGKPVAVVLTIEQYEKILKPRSPRLDPLTIKSIEETRRKIARGERAGISIEEAFPDLMGTRD